MFDNLKNMAGMMGQFKDIRQRMEQMQAEMERKVVEADAGAGAVRAQVNGKLEVVSVRIDPVMLSVLAGPGENAQADQQMVEELIAAAVNAALDKAKEMVAEEMAQVTGGMDIPGLDKLMG